VFSLFGFPVAFLFGKGSMRFLKCGKCWIKKQAAFFDLCGHAHFPYIHLFLCAFFSFSNTNQLSTMQVIHVPFTCIFYFPREASRVQAIFL